MTLDKSLRVRSGVARSRSVLTRAERIAKLVSQDRFDEEKDSPFALPKVRVMKLAFKRKKKAKKIEEGEGEGTESTES
jgi:small basic protein (TIGR04137 family)